MKLKHKISLLVIGVLLVVSILISSSYALWVFNVSQESTNVVQSDCFEITYEDGPEIALENAFPLKDSKGVQLKPYTFTINNICNHAADFQINLETLNTSTLDASNIKAKLDNTAIALYGDNNYVAPTLNSASSAILLKEDYLEENASKTYSLRMWLKEDAVKSEVENTTYNSKITVRSTLKKEYAEGTLIKGSDFNNALKVLAGAEEYEYNFLQKNTNVTAIEWSNSEPKESDNYINVATSDSDYPVYAWFSDGIIYLYSNNTKIYFNEDSSYYFSYFDSISTLNLKMFDTSKSKNMYGMFKNCTNITTLDVSNFDTTNVEDITQMFWSMSNITSLDLSSFNTPNLKKMYGLFGWDVKLENVNISSFNTSNVENMGCVFCYNYELKEIDVSNFDTSNVTTMTNMFRYARKITSLDVSNFNTSKVTNMSDMFSMVSKITELDVTNFDTSNVTNMSSMFEEIRNVKKLDISNFDTSKVTNMNTMFAYSTKLETIYVGSNWTTANVTSGDDMFDGCSKLVGGDGTTYFSYNRGLSYAVVDDPANGKPGYFTLKAN